MELKERFEQFTSPGYYSRVDSDHILELYIGLDETGNKSIELRSLFRPRSVKGTSAIDVSQYENEKYKTIRFSLKCHCSAFSPMEKTVCFFKERLSE